MGLAPSVGNSLGRLSDPTDHFGVSMNKADAPIAEYTEAASPTEVLGCVHRPWLSERALFP